MKNILILGYYNRNNLGDDVFEYVFDKFLSNVTKYYDINYTIANLDTISEIPTDTDLILFGGGDLINDYFIDKLNALNTPKVCPTYAVSVGIPYVGLIDKRYLDIFDVIVHRNKPDHEKLVGMYSEHRVKHLPDLSMLLPRLQPSSTLVTQSYIPLNIQKGTKRIGVCLANSIYSDKDPSKYQTILENLSTFFLRVANIKKQIKKPFLKCLSDESFEENLYEIYFVPFCTDKDTNQDDNRINQDVYSQIQQYQTADNVHILKTPLNIEEIIPVFNTFDMTVCTRFHAHVFSAICNVPMLSIYSSRKVEHLLDELNLLEYGYKMEVNSEWLYPIELDNETLMQKFNHVVKNYDTIKNELISFNALNKQKLDNLEVVLGNLLYYPIKYHESTEIHTLGLLKSSDVVYSILKYFNISTDQNGINVDEIATHNGSMKWLFETNGIPSDDETKNKLANVTSFVLTRNKVTEYNFGIADNILTEEYNLLEACKWILQDYQHKFTKSINYNNLDNKVHFKHRKLNMNYLVQHGLEGYHRSGWNFVLQNLRRLNNSNTDAPIFDSYLDRTFGWDYEFLTKIGFLPYKRKWTGVFHHTPNEEYSEHNLVEAFKKPLFIQSLQYCKLLIVFSDYLKEWIELTLCTLNIDVPVVMLYHPSQTIDECLRFDPVKYIKNKTKKIIHIGAWLRNSYSIYELDVPRRFSKYALKGKAMDNYFITNETLGCITDTVLKCVNDKSLDENCGLISRDTKKMNKYGLGLVDLIRKNHYSVNLIDRITNEMYDRLLSQNVVFINLVDASAVNTLIECIVRNTPILVNRLPATVQYLGEGYPLFYFNLEHAKHLLKTDVNIIKAYKYLKSLDKSKFDVVNCIVDLISSEPYKNL